jgi:hypothetical protein
MLKKSFCSSVYVYYFNVTLGDKIVIVETSFFVLKKNKKDVFVDFYI